MSKRYAGASGATLVDAAGTCPLWHAHAVFERPLAMMTQTIVLEDGGAAPAHWFTISAAIAGSGHAEARFGISLGLEARLAADLAQARGMSLDPADATEIGPGCRNCRRPDCRQRSLPPDNARIRFDPTERRVSPYVLAAGD